MTEVYRMYFIDRNAICRGPSAIFAEPPYFSPIETPETLRTIKLIFYNPFDGSKYLEIGSDIQENILTNLEYSVGENGCDKFSFELAALPRKYIRPRTRVDIGLFAEIGRPRFSGYIEEVPAPNLRSDSYSYSGFGFFSQLDWILVTGTFSNVAISGIVRQIVMDYVEPYTDIFYNSSKIEDTGYVPTEISFDHESVMQALKDLATLAGNFEIGVDAERQFYFRAVDTEVNEDFVFFSEKHCEQFEVSIKADKIYNRIYVKSGELQESGDDEGTNWAGPPVENEASIALWGLREKVETAPSILGDADALRWGEYLLEREKDPILKGKVLEASFGNERIEPRGKSRVWSTVLVPTSWTEAQLSYLGTRVPNWDWTSISPSEVFTGQIFWEWAGTNLVTFCYEAYIKRLTFKISKAYSVDVELGEIEDLISDEFSTLVLRVRREELLAQQNTEQLFALT